MAKLSDYIKQEEETTLTCLKDCTILINLDNYEMNNNIKIYDDQKSIWVKSLIASLEFQDTIFNVVLDYPVELKIQEMIYIKKESIKLIYKKNSILFEIPTEAVELKENVLYVQRLLAGQEIFKDTSHLFMKLLQVYSPPISDMDSVHLEILLSNCLRDKENLTIPARLGKVWNPTMVNIKKVVFSSGFLNGLAFEDVNQAINTGLIAGEDKEPSILERVLTGTLIEEEKA